MKYLITILLLLPFLVNAQTPTANAGTDQTIYTNTVILTGTATNRNASRWTDISNSGAITNPTSLKTTVTGLRPGTYYFELDVISGVDIHATDTVKVIVNNPVRVEVNSQIILHIVSQRQRVNLFDFAGRLIESKEGSEIVYLPKPSAGIYVLQVGTFTKKIMIR